MSPSAGRSLWLSPLLVAASLSPLAAQVWSGGTLLRDLLGSGGAAYYGGGVAAGDFDDDGDDDLAVGAELFSGSYSDEGTLVVYRSGPNRALDYWGGSFGGGNDHRLGTAVAVGDFDGDQRDEIAASAPGYGVFYNGSVRAGAGAVVAFDFASGFWSTRILSQVESAAVDPPESSDQLGYALAVGDFNGDDYDDLAVGVPYEDFGGLEDAGVVLVFYGSAAGLAAAESPTTQHLASAYDGIAGTPGAGDQFGWALAAGDLDDDGYDDLAIGAPHRTVSTTSDAGQVSVLFGTPAGLTGSNQYLLDESDFTGRSPVVHERFGQALAIGNFDQTALCLFVAPPSCYDDLAIGIPRAAVTPPGGFPVANAGAVLVAYSSSSGLGTTPGEFQVLSQNDVAGAGAESGDEFGGSLAAGSLHKPSLFSGAIDDLVVGAQSETVGAGPSEEGFVQLFFGSTAGLDAGVQEQTFHEQPGLLLAPAAAVDHFGQTLAIGDLDGDGWGDLLLGVPLKDRHAIGDSGAVEVLFGALFADGFESGGLTGWSNY